MLFDVNDLKTPQDGSVETATHGAVRALTATGLAFEMVSQMQPDKKWTHDEVKKILYNVIRDIKAEGLSDGMLL